MCYPCDVERESSVPTRNVVLTDHQHQVVETLVQSGRYQNASEVLREGLRLIEQRDAEDTARLEAPREAAQIGWADAEAGRYTEIGDGELDEYIAALGRRAAASIRTSS
jgi:antitoxin ParD1/3/4